MQHATILNRLSFKTSGKLLTCAGLVALADILFYDHPIGWTFGLFGLVLLFAMQLYQTATSHSRHVTVAACAVAGLALALIEAPTTLSVLMYGLSIVALALLTKLTCVDDVRVLLKAVLRYIFTGWMRLQRDWVIMSHIGKRRRKGQPRSRSVIRNWLLPVVMSGIFIWLFAKANPIIMQWADAVDWNYLTRYFSVWREVYWLSVACICWSLIRPKFKQREKVAQPATKSSFTLTGLLFNERSIFLSLVVFNGLFLVQNLMDIAFLWTGAALPDGMTHAQYAHQGAYPLIVTALLAALFVLIALKPGSASEQMASIRALVYAWVGQNILLVFSSIIRLTDYIEVYSLTYLRIAAFIWMLLVALGLVLIVARIYSGRSNRWLINTNCLALYATLYLCCFVNFGSMIAEYNVRHSQEVTGQGAALDTYYLHHHVGTAAIPALLWYEQHYPHAATTNAVSLREMLQREAETTTQNWRTWTFLDYRMSRFANPASPAAR